MSFFLASSCIVWLLGIISSRINGHTDSYLWNVPYAQRKRAFIYPMDFPFQLCRLYLRHAHTYPEDWTAFFRWRSEEVHYSIKVRILHAAISEKHTRFGLHFQCRPHPHAHIASISSRFRFSVPQNALLAWMLCARGSQATFRNFWLFPHTGRVCGYPSGQTSACCSKLAAELTSNSRISWTFTTMLNWRGGLISAVFSACSLLIYVRAYFAVPPSFAKWKVRLLIGCWKSSPLIKNKFHIISFRGLTNADFDIGVSQIVPLAHLSLRLWSSGANRCS